MGEGTDRRKIGDLLNIYSFLWSVGANEAADWRIK
jgi:hypothetical protein